MNHSERPAARQRRGPSSRRRWVGPLLILLVTAAWAVLITQGSRAGAAAWILFPLVLPLLGLATLVGAFVGAVRKRSTWRQAAPVMLVGGLAIYPVTWMGMNHPFAFPVSAERVKPAAHIRVPADVPMTVLWGGSRLRSNYHANQPEGRWAYDLGVEPHPDWQSTPGLTLEDYGCWGTPIVAPAAGRVLAAHDGTPDNPLGAPWSFRYPPDPGNFVAIEIEGGTVLSLLHLQRGSVRVSPGDAVREGEVIGRCGNSGNSSAPHLHLDHRPTLPSPDRRLPFLVSLPLFFRDHDGEPMPEGGFRRDAEGRRNWTGATITHSAARPYGQER